MKYQSKINFQNVELHHDENLKKLIISQSLLALRLFDKNVREEGAVQISTYTANVDNSFNFDNLKTIILNLLLIRNIRHKYYHELRGFKLSYHCSFRLGALRVKIYRCKNLSEKQLLLTY